ncbi:MAG: glycosyltransferase family 2 protein [Lachnospiraceae bacterium]
MDKLVSIIIPCYNVEQYVERCFNSIKTQTLGFEKIELIFVNDGSSDNTLEKLSKIEEQYPENIIVINFEENRGQGAARNCALEYASAPYVGFVDSDDWIEDTMFKKLIDTIAKYNCDFVECRWNYATDEGFFPVTFEEVPPGFYDLSKSDIKNEIISIQLGFTSMCNKVFKKDFIIDNDIFCPEGLRYEDIFFCYLAFLYADSYYAIEDVFYHYYSNPKGTVQQIHNTYQLDKMDIALGFIETCKERGLMEKHKDIIEWMFLEKYYIYMLWEIFEAFPQHAYECYQQMKMVVKEMVPDYQTNPFRFLKRNQPDNIILKLIDIDLSEQDLFDIKNKLFLKLKQ